MTKYFFYINKKLFSSLPLILFYILAFVEFNFLSQFDFFSIFSFNLQMIIIYFYVFNAPHYLGYGHIFLVGLINDTVMGTPLGATSISYLMLCIFSIYLRNVTLRTRAVTQWFTFIPSLFFSNLIYFLIINNFSNLSYFYVQLLQNSFFTFLVFPIFYYFFSIHHRMDGGEKNAEF